MLVRELNSNMNKLEAIIYLHKNSVYDNEWTGAGMWEAVESVLESEKEIFSEVFLKALLSAALNK